MKIAEAYVELRMDGSKAKADAKQAATGAAGVAKQALGLFSAALFVGGINKAIGAASRLEQAVGGTSAVFGEAAGKIDDFASTSAKSLGISAAATRELTSQIGGLLKGFGFTQDAAADMSIKLTTLGSDLAATFGGAPEEAVQALGAALRGETDPLERFGVSLNQTQINLKAVELGLAETTAKVDPNAKAQAALALIYERTADAQGQSAREADTAAGAQVRAAAAAEDAAAKFGDQLLPVYAAAQKVIGALAIGFAALPGPIQLGVVALLGFIALAGPLKSIIDVAKTSGPAFSRLAGGLRSVGPAATLAGAGLAIMAVQLLEIWQTNKDIEEGGRDVAKAIAETGDAAVVGAAGVDELLARYPEFRKFMKAEGLDTGGVVELLQRGKDGFDELWLSVLQGGPVTGIAADDLEELGNGLKSLSLGLSASEEELEAQRKALDSQAAATDAATESTAGLTNQVDRGRDTLHATEEEIRFAARALEDLGDGMTDAERATDRMSDSVSRLQDLLSDRDAYHEAIAAQNELIWANQIAIDTARSQKVTEEEKAEALDASKEALRRSIDATLTYIDTVGGIPPSQETIIQAFIDQDKLAEAEAWLAHLARARTAFITAVGQGSLGFQKDDVGGFIPAGQIHEVAEKRAEFVNGVLIAGPADVTSGAETARILGRMGQRNASSGGGGLSIGTLVVGDRRDLPETRATLDRVLWEMRFR